MPHIEDRRPDLIRNLLSGASPTLRDPGFDIGPRLEARRQQRESALAPLIGQNLASHASGRNLDPGFSMKPVQSVVQSVSARHGFPISQPQPQDGVQYFADDATVGPMDGLHRPNGPKATHVAAPDPYGAAPGTRVQLYGNNTAPPTFPPTLPQVVERQTGIRIPPMPTVPQGGGFIDYSQPDWQQQEQALDAQLAAMPQPAPSDGSLNPQAASRAQSNAAIINQSNNTRINNALYRQKEIWKFQDQYLHGANDIGGAAYDEYQTYLSGQTPAYALKSPAARRAAYEHAQANPNHAQNLRRQQYTAEADRRANTPNDATGGMTPNDWIASRAGTGVPRTPAQQATNTAAGAAAEKRRLNALQRIQQRKAARGQQQGQSIIAPDMGTYGASVPQPQAKFSEMRPFLPSLKSYSDKDEYRPPFGYDDDQTDEEYDKWLSEGEKRQKRWQDRMSGKAQPTPAAQQPQSQPQTQQAPQTFTDTARQAWGSVGSFTQADILTPEEIAQVDWQEVRRQLIASGMSQHEADSKIASMAGTTRQP